MKQILQSRKTGKPFVADVPVPALQRGGVLVRTIASLISAGTERAAVENLSKGLVHEARQRPDLVKAVVTRVKTEGLISTVTAVREKIAASQALGYSAAGEVIEVGSDIDEFKVGDRVACAGVGFASHAEVIAVPKNLCAHLSDEVSFEDGAFGTLGAIALQGVRLTQPTLGESVVVIGLGLVGQLTVQLLKANGCRVFGLDVDPERVKLALDLGADMAALSDGEASRKISSWTCGHGADAVLITAATESNQPVELAASVSRLKGRVVIVGMTGLDIPRQPFFARELSLTISMSYGPGRYDADYEQRGHDYPLPYVRWTEKRNIESFLELVATRKVNVGPLITHRFAITEADQAYDLIARQRNYLAVVLNYDVRKEVSRRVEIKSVARDKQSFVHLGVVGAGGYVPAMLLPHFRQEGVSFESIATGSGISAIDVGKRFGFRSAVSSATEVMDDAGTNLIVIGTRHDLHAQLAVEALKRDKHVFVEKPLALNDEQLDEVVVTAENSRGTLMVGFNRRFSPLARKASEFFSSRSTPLSMVYRINAGRIDKSHWIQHSSEGGGRIVGEVCHFVDLMQFLTSSRPISVFASSIGARSDQVIDADSVLITLYFADGSIGTIAYCAEGDKALPKERLEIFGDGRSFVLDDYKRASMYKNGKEERLELRSQDKGQAEQVKAVCAALLSATAPPISLDELEATTRTTFRILDSLKSQQPIEIPL